MAAFARYSIATTKPLNPAAAWKLNPMAGTLGCSFDYVETVAGAALHGRTSRQLQNLLAEIGRH
jgi:hypothetical protein